MNNNKNFKVMVRNKIYNYNLYEDTIMSFIQPIMKDHLDDDTSLKDIEIEAYYQLIKMAKVLEQDLNFGRYESALPFFLRECKKDDTLKSMKLAQLLSIYLLLLIGDRDQLVAEHADKIADMTVDKISRSEDPMDVSVKIDEIFYHLGIYKVLDESEDKHYYFKKPRI